MENKTIAEKKHKKQNRLITNYYIIKFFSGLYLGSQYVYSTEEC